MKVLMLIKHSESLRQDQIPQQLMDAMGKFVQEGFRSGVLKDTAGLKGTAEGLRVRQSGGRLTVIDGPFSEAKEVVAGYWVWQVKSLEEAIEWLKRAPFRDGEVEVRPIFELSDFDMSKETRERFEQQDARLRSQQQQRH